MKSLTKDVATGKFENLRVKIKEVVGIVTRRGKLEANGGQNLADEHQERAGETRGVMSIRMTSIRMTSSRSQCENCRHFRPWFRGRTTCDAYPEDIPAEITDNRVNHQLPYVGDHGIRYEAIHLEDDGQDSAENDAGTEDR